MLIFALVRGKTKEGKWRTPFAPLASSHRKDDYCEGNAWQWSFFVPHDVEGLAALMGGKERLAAAWIRFSRCLLHWRATMYPVISRPDRTICHATNPVIIRFICIIKWAAI